MNKRLFSLVLVLALMLGLGSVVMATEVEKTAIAKPGDVKIEQAKEEIVLQGDAKIAIGEWYATFTSSETAANYTVEAKLLKGKNAVSNAVGEFSYVTGTTTKFYAKITAPSDKYKLSVQLKVTSAGTTANKLDSEVVESSEVTISNTAGAIAGAAFDKDAETFTFTKDAAKKLYYRVSKGDKAAEGTWKEVKATDLVTGETNSVFSVSKLITKKGVVEFILSATAPAKGDFATTFIKIAADQSTITAKPKVTKYIAVGDQFYALISDITDEYSIKRVTDDTPEPIVAYVAGNSDETFGVYIKTAITTSDDKFEGVATGFYYPVGPTATELHIVKPATGAAAGQIETTTGYTAASKAVKVKVAALVKSPTPKVNYAKNVISMKDKGMDVFINNKWENITGDALFDATNKGLKLNAKLNAISIKDGNNLVTLRTAVTEKKPGSAEVKVYIMRENPIVVSSSADLDDYMAIVDGKKLMATSGGYALEHEVDGKWKKGLPKVSDGKVAATKVRFAAGGKYAAGEAFFIKYENGAFAYSADGTNWGGSVVVPTEKVAVTITAATPTDGSTPVIKYSLVSADDAKTNGTTYSAAVDVNVDDTIYYYATSTVSSATQVASGSYKAIAADVENGKTIAIAAGDFAAE